MASIVIDHLFSTKPKGSTGIAYIYFDYTKKEEQSLRNLLAVLLRQLAYSGDTVHDSVKQLYKNRIKTARPTLDSLLDALDSVICRFESVFLVVDALDECSSPECRKEFMQVLLTLQSRFKANVLVTSVPDPKITRIFQSGEYVVKDIVSSSEDVQTYLSDKLCNVYPGLIKEGQTSLDNCANEILHYAGGIFLIAQLYMNVLHHMDISSDSEFRKTLHELQRDPKEAGSRKPELLKRMYAKTMQRIQSRSEDLAVRTLMYVTCAVEQMTSRELHSALTIAMLRENKTTIPEESTDDFMAKVLSLCLGLLIIDPATGHVRFFHSTASEYFTSTRDTYFAEANTEVAKACVNYLSKFTPPHPEVRADAFQRWMESHQFYRYAASYWGHHARATSKCLDQIMEFLGHHDSVDMAGVALVNSIKLPDKYRFIDEPEVVAGNFVGRMRAIHLVAFFGLEEVFHRLISADRQKILGFPTRRCRKALSQKATTWQLTPLHFAVLGRQKDMAKLLLDYGAVVDKEDLYRRTPLALAMELYYKDMSALLRKNGGKVNVLNKKEKALKWGMLGFSNFIRVGL